MKNSKKIFDSLNNLLPFHNSPLKEMNKTINNHREEVYGK